MKKLSIDQVDLKGKKVFIRVDFNAPLENGLVTDDTRIKAAIPTIKLAISQGARVIVASHLGRPKGEVKPEYSLLPVKEVFSKSLGAPVLFAEDCVGEKTGRLVDSLKNGEVALLENLRFHKEEENNDEDFARALADMAEIYVNDAFGAAHRAHASTEGITHFVKTSVAGLLMKNEIEYFSRSMINPERPLAVALGGAKISSKLGVVDSLIDKCDILIVGGAMAFTFLKALGVDVASNMVEDNKINEIMGVMARARKKGVKLYLPVDFVVGESLEDDIPTEAVTRQELPPDKIAGDIGPASSILFKLALKPARTIIWNGPMGVFEKKPYAGGTLAVATAMAVSRALT
ncbi:Phosphoglycerate kinase, partial [hydrothermal vent metagenome]